MEFEKQVCCRNLARRLKELGAKQESVFWWCGQPDCLETVQQSEDRYCESCSLVGNNSAAFTVAELGEMFPYFWTLKWQRDGGPNLISCTNEMDGKTYYERNIETEADARAEMLVYLFEH